MKVVVFILLAMLTYSGVVQGDTEIGSNSTKIKDITKLRYEVNNRLKGVDKSVISWAWSVLFKQDSIGAKRLAEETPDTLPTGDILLMPEGVVIALNKDKYKKITNLKIYNKKTNKLIFSKKIIKDFLLVPKKYFSCGGNYKIKCKVFTDDYVISIDDEFHILSKKDHAEFQKYAETKLKIFKGKNLKNFILAVLYYDYGYDYNGNVKILEIRK